MPTKEKKIDGIDDIPKKTSEYDKAAKLWCKKIDYCSEIKDNRPDIVVRDIHEEICLSNDWSALTDGNASLKEMEKFSKYSNLEIEITEMSSLKLETIPVIDTVVITNIRETNT